MATIEIDIPDFEIKSVGNISQSFLNNKLLTFHQATDFVRNLAYRRNENKHDLSTLFVEQCGTCSTKHALLKQLLDEHQIKNVQLMIGIFQMNAKNTPAIAATLSKHYLDYMPEAHCYLKFQGAYFDFTKRNATPSNFVNELIQEIEIEADQITDFKVTYHQEYLKKWLIENKLNLSFEELWKIREQCIKDLC